MSRFDYMKMPQMPHEYKCEICTKEISSDEIICKQCANYIDRARHTFPKEDWSLRICNNCLDVSFANTDFYEENPNKKHCGCYTPISNRFLSEQELVNKGII